MSFFAQLLLASSVPQEASEYEHRCEVRTPLADGGEINGTITVNARGEIGGFFASTSRPWSRIDQAFSVRDFNGSEYVDANVRWSISWHDARADLRAADISFREGRLELNLSRRKTLPREVAATLRHESSDDVALIAFASRWPGHKSGAAFRFPLTHLLGMADGRAELYWTLLRAPAVNVGFGSKVALAEGRLGLADVRAIAPAFEAFKHDLFDKVSAYRTACRREVVHIDPNGET